MQNMGDLNSTLMQGVFKMAADGGQPQNTVPQSKGKQGGKWASEMLLLQWCYLYIHPIVRALHKGTIWSSAQNMLKGHLI